MGELTSVTIGNSTSKANMTSNRGQEATVPDKTTVLPHNEIHRVKGVRDIQWFMLDKKVYFPLTVVNMFAVRTLLYPLTVVRTRLQVQSRGSLYSGTWNALGTVVKYEGPLGLYKGFWVNSLQLFPHVIYITVYEKARLQVSYLTNNLYAMAFLGGASGSMVAQILSVPIDIISQHMMLAGQKGSSSSSSNQHAATAASKIRDIDRIHIPENIQRSGSSMRIVKYISTEILKNESFLGFYRGYMLSTFLVSLNSALWWPFYYFYQGKLRPIIPEDFPTLAVQCLCGPLSSFSANFLTNPLDCMRTRMQVSKVPESGIKVLKDLWEQDGYRLFYRGLTARLSYSCFYSFFIILGYETVKRASLKEEYKPYFY